MKRFYPITLIAACAAGLVFPGTSVSASSGGGYSVEASVWMSSGQCGFQVGSPIWVISELEYPMDGILAEIRASAPLFTSRSFDVRARGRYSTQLAYEGTSKDSDYLDFPGLRSHYSECDSDADVSIWDLDAVAAFRPLADVESDLLASLEIGVFAGYGMQSFDYDDRNLDASYEYGTDRFFIPGPISTYKVEFSGFRVGALASLQVVEGVTVKLDAVFMPDMHAEGDGDWMLRNYRFSHEASGLGVLINASVNWQINETVGIFGAIRSASLIADSGGVESANQDGDVYTDWPIIPQITGEYAGIEGGVVLNF
ncbi:MAG: hypothetical protein FJ224_05155 [Lentisphaerae bacterium]|nr:hypothetical protein [Lentisphaerota bacterium]